MRASQWSTWATGFTSFGVAPGSAFSPRNMVRAARCTAASNGICRGPARHQVISRLNAKCTVAGWQALSYGGPLVYPLLVLGVLAFIIIVDRVVAYRRCLRLPAEIAALVETYGFAWSELERRLETLPEHNAYRRFLGVIAQNRHQPAWWVESRAGDEAGSIERTLSRGLWILETVVTAAPLLGLLGTITGMMQAFKVIGGSGLVAPTEVTAGVAEALIATALGLLIAVFALFGFNFF